jgi:hypothetical protein
MGVTMRYALFLLFILSSGCVLNQPQSFVYITETTTSNVSNTSSVSTKTIKETSAPPPKPVIIEHTVSTTNITCAEFKLPPSGNLPPKPKFSDPAQKDKVDIDAILTAHIKTLEKHVESERGRVEQAYREWQVSCK